MFESLDTDCFTGISPFMALRWMLNCRRGGTGQRVSRSRDQAEDYPNADDEEGESGHEAQIHTDGLHEEAVTRVGFRGLFVDLVRR